MKFRYAVFFILIALAFASCQKNTASKIPQISLQYFGRLDGSDTINKKKDTCLLRFSITDGDADLGNPQPGPPYDIYLINMSLDSGSTQPIFFPVFDQAIENPKTGIQGVCNVYFYPGVQPTIDTKPGSDTVYFKVYIQDRAGHHSDTVTTRIIHAI